MVGARRVDTINMPAKSGIITEHVCIQCNASTPWWDQLYHDVMKIGKEVSKVYRYLCLEYSSSLKIVSGI